jgi:pre-mRNA-splicing helicase BRR2
MQDDGEAEEDEDEGEDATMEGELKIDEGSLAAVKADDHLDARSIDAYWLQRELSKTYKDATDSQKKADEVIKVLRDAKDDRECENSLVLLLGFDLFDFIKILRKNRLLVLYATLMARAQNEDEVARLEAEMRADPAAADVLRRMREGEGDQGEEAEAKRRAAVRQEKLDEDLEMADVEDAKTSARGPKELLDFESLTFQSGGHLMANKKCVLPDDSFRKTIAHKGYEEVHVPGKKAKISPTEKKVPIADLPEYAQQAFEVSVWVCWVCVCELPLCTHLLHLCPCSWWTGFYLSKSRAEHSVGDGPQDGREHAAVCTNWRWQDQCGSADHAADYRQEPFARWQGQPRCL